MAARNRMPPWHEHVRLANGRDILIRPQLDGVTSSSFGAVDEALVAGYAAAIGAEAAWASTIGHGSPAQRPARKTMVISMVRAELGQTVSIAASWQREGAREWRLPHGFVRDCASARFSNPVRTET